jgi:hypothetical protein
VSTIPDRVTSDILVEHVKVLPHIRGQHPPPLASATSISASGARRRAPSGGRGHIGRSRLHVGATVAIANAITIGFNVVIFVVDNETTVMKIIVDGSRTGHYHEVKVCVHWVQCGGVDDLMRCMMR